MKKLVLLVSVFTLIFFSIYTSYINTNTTAAYKNYSINRVLYWVLEEMT
ncbi:hypothetical protein [Caloranaerobacter azorensis]|uniref:Uncharacterized protein n=1 Tax=Caloranaerobacter azorensis TaxID=116090 RepID=A0A6P1YEE8_9FIRM|nr:hypothetical protein [Caloranaerobacter azorensis]QIB27729.1 hypothetical protein G3A45_10805 [Caloranaerobacter azorensis]